MLKFLTSVFSFLVALVGWMALNFVYNYHQLQKPVELNAKTLIAGDSHLRFGVDPELFPSAVNVCIGAEPLLITYYKLRRLLTDNPEINTVLVGYSYNNFSAYQDEKLWGNRAKSQYNKYYPVLPLTLPQYAQLNVEKFYHTYIERLMLYPNPDRKPYMGEHDKMKSNLKNADIEAIMERHYTVAGVEAGISEISGHYLDSIINLTTLRKVQLILVATPLHPEYTKRLPAQIEHYWGTKTKELMKRGVIIYDYSEWPYPDDHFHDHDHLSSIGTEVFTKELVKKIASSKE